MRVAFRFRKGGAARYIAHLDLMRAMNRAIRRAGLPAKVSQGFHPHIVLSFAQALGLGYLSEGEYMEIGLPDGDHLPEAMDALNRAAPPGIVFTGVWMVPDKAQTLMAQVTAARWRVEFTAPLGEEANGRILSLLARETIEVIKDGKNGPAAMEIRKGILAVEPKGGFVELFLSAGSTLNVRPELVVKAAFGGTEQVCATTRLELYTSINERFTPLSQVFLHGDTDGFREDDPG